MAHFPVEVKNFQTQIPEEMTFGRGSLYPTGVTSNSTTKAQLDAAINGNPLLGLTVGGSISAESGELIKVKGLTLGASEKIKFAITINDDDLITGSSRLLSTKYVWAGGDFGTVYFPLDTLIKANQFMVFRIVDYDRKSLLNEEHSVSLSMDVHGNRSSFYHNIGVSRVLAFRGDSITYGTGPTHTYTMYQTYFWNLLKGLGLNLGIDLLGYPGFQTNHVKSFEPSGYWDCSQKEARCFAFGTNDAVQNIGTSVYKANMKSFVLRNLYDGRDPDKPVLIFGPISINNNTNEARAVLIRQANLEIYNEIILSEPLEVSNRLFVIDLSQHNNIPAFDRSVLTNYYLSDGVHPSDLATLGIKNNVLIPLLFKNSAKLNDVKNLTPFGERLYNALKN